MKFTKTVLLATLALSAFNAQAAGNLVQDGSFESASITSGWHVYTNGAGNTLPNWTLGSGAGIEIQNNQTVRYSSGAFVYAQEGQKYVELDSHAGNGGLTTPGISTNSMMFQDIATTIGGKYDVSFWYMPRPGVAQASNVINYSFGTSAGSINSVANALHTWEQVAFHFTATSLSTKLSFSAGGTVDTLGGFVDNVSVMQAVPEPESYALLLAGLGLMGTIARRRKSRD
jgi:hypothetical protein